MLSAVALMAFNAHVADAAKPAEKKAEKKAEAHKEEKKEVRM